MSFQNVYATVGNTVPTVHLGAIFYSHQTIGMLPTIYPLMIMSEVGPIAHRELLDKKESRADGHTPKRSVWVRVSHASLRIIRCYVEIAKSAIRLKID